MKATSYVLVVAAVVLAGAPAVSLAQGGASRGQQERGESAAVLLEKGIHQEQTAGDLDAAIKIYRQIVDDAAANRPHVAEALYRLGGCLAKKRRHAEALAAFEKLIADYGDQKQLVARARARLAESRKNMSEAEVAEVVKAAVMTISTLVEGDPRVGKAMATLDGLNEKAVVASLAGFLDSQIANVRRSAIYILWKGPMGDVGPAAAKLLKLCGHQESFTRGMAALVVGERRIDAGYKALCGMALKDSSGYARRCAAYALGLMGRAEARGVLEQALKDSDDAVAANAKAALKLLAEPAPAAQPAGKNVPLVVATTPEVFANDVSPALGRITVTFDRAMMDKSWSWTQRFAGTFPKTTGTPAYDAARTTCALPVKLEPGKVYWVGVNHDPHLNFKSPQRVPAARHVILFATASAEGKPTPIPAKYLPEARAVNSAAIEIAAGLKRRYVGKVVSAFAEKADLSAPESACAALHRALAGMDADAAAKLSWTKIDPDGLRTKWKRADPKDLAVYNKAQLDARVIEVLTYRERLAAVISLLAFPKGVGRHPYSLRSFGLIGGQWKNLGEDRCGSLAGARGNFDAKKGNIFAEFQKISRAAEAAEADANAKKIAQAVSAAVEWLKLVDEGKYAESWSAAAGFFKSAMTSQKWQAQMRTFRRPLGKATARKLLRTQYATSLPGAPDGEYVLIQYQTSFEQKQSAVETVTPMRDKDGVWRVSGYYIK